MSNLLVPQLTLGWGVLNWCSTYLAQPADRAGRVQGAKWVFTDEQALFILNLYAIDEHGSFIYHQGMLSRPKGWGKSPLLAAICAAELLGPVQFAGFDHRGNPVGEARYASLVQIAATAYDQTDNTMQILIEMLGQGEANNVYDLDISLTRIRTPSNGLIVRITNNSKSNEGKRPDFVVMDETHLWDESNGGVEFASGIWRNLTKTEGRSIETTNAPVPGAGSVAEITDKWANDIRVAGETFEQHGLLYDNIEVYVEDITDKDAVMAVLPIAYGNSCKENGGWINLERVWADIQKPGTTEADARRFFLNQRVLRGAQWLNPLKWKAMARKDQRVRKGDPIALGFRGQTRNGACALVATRLSDNFTWPLKYWETSKDAPEIPYVEVDDFVRDCLNFYNVKLFFAAPQNWQDIVGRWYLEHEGIVEEFWTSTKLKYAKITEEFETAVYTERLIHDGDEILKNHIDNCLLEELPSGMHIPRKASKHSDNYISVAEAAILSFAAAQEAIQRGLNVEGPSGYVFTF